MNRRMAHCIGMVITMSMLLLQIPSTSSKYMLKSNYTMGAQSNYSIYARQTVQVNNLPKGVSEDVHITESGLYAVLLKGGAGGRGTKSDGSKMWTTPNGGYIDGGKGGVVFTCFNLDANTYLKCCIGSAGDDAEIVDGVGNPGAAGDNTTNLAKGCVGANLKTYDGTLFAYYEGDKANAGPGSGAGTILYYSSTASNKNLIAIAGGGGGGSSWDHGYSFTVPSGKGGDGGNMFTPFNTVLNVAIKQGSSTVNTGSVFFGSPAPTEIQAGDDRGPFVPDSNTKYAYRQRGGGGGTSGGVQGAVNSCSGGMFAMKGVTAVAGSSFANGGTGGQSRYHGGPGGGGYCGGGGGAGSSITSSAGGGGGGSSFLTNAVNGNNVITLNSTVRGQILDYMYNKSHFSLTDSEGFAIILYLGKNTPENRQALGIS